MNEHFNAKNIHFFDLLSAIKETKTKFRECHSHFKKLIAQIYFMYKIRKKFIKQISPDTDN